MSQPTVKDWAHETEYQRIEILRIDHFSLMSLVHDNLSTYSNLANIHLKLL